MTDKIHAAMEECRENAPLGARALRSIMIQDPNSFLGASVLVLRDHPDSPGRDQLLKVLANADQVIERLCDPNGITGDESVHLIVLLAQAQPHVDTKLARLLHRAHTRAGFGGELEHILRLVDAIPPSARTSMTLAGLLHDPNPRLRAKVVLLLGRRAQNTRFAEERMREKDPRVRANAIEALWGNKTASAGELLWRATKDANNRVVGNALLGLYHLNHLDAADCILRKADDPNPKFRATAAWVMGQAADPRFLPALEKLTRDLYTLVRQNARKAIGRITHRAEPSTDPLEKQRP